MSNATEVGPRPTLTAKRIEGINIIVQLANADIQTARSINEGEYPDGHAVHAGMVYLEELVRWHARRANARKSGRVA